MKHGDALSLKVQCDISNDQYQMIRNSFKVLNANIYPTLLELWTEKEKTYPEDIEYNTETSAFTPLQKMLDHTLKRLLQLPEAKNNLQ